MVKRTLVTEAQIVLLLWGGEAKYYSVMVLGGIENFEGASLKQFNFKKHIL